MLVPLYGVSIPDQVSNDPAALLVKVLAFAAAVVNETF
jgi:hypothetical protein